MVDHPLLTAYEALNAKAATASPARITYDIAISQREAARNALNEALRGPVLPGWSNLSDGQRADIEAHVRGLNDGAETYAMDRPPRVWRCFHCGEIFRTEDGARLHFGATPTDRPVCSTPPSRPQGEEGLREERDRLATALEFYRDAFEPRPAKGRLALGLEWRPSERLLEDCGNRAAEALALSNQGKPSS
jgi:hypothetical protein